MDRFVSGMYCYVDRFVKPLYNQGGNRRNMRRHVRARGMIQRSTFSLDDTGQDAVTGGNVNQRKLSQRSISHF